VIRPETRFAWNGDVSLAYQVVGDGPIDLLYLQGYVSQVDLSWDSPYLARFLRGLAGQGRLIFTDRRGWGCSDRFSPSDVTDIDMLTDDLRVVMDAADSTRAVLVASHECTLVASLFAASYPDRSAGLVLIDPWVTYSRTEGTPWLESIDEWGAYLSELRVLGPSLYISEFPAGYEREQDWYGVYVRAAISVGAAIAEFRRYLPTDIRGILPTIQIPTLVLADGDAEGDAITGPEMSPRNGRLAAELIPGSRLVELPGGDMHPRRHWYARAEAILAEIEGFTTGVRNQESSFARALATVLFTDIVGSVEWAAELGDTAWRDLVARHHATVRAMLARYRGREVDTAGDGFFATFDGPARAVYCAMAIAEAVRPLGLQVRVGLHTGEVETAGDTVGGMAVNIGARIAGLAGPSEVLTSSTVKDLVAGSGIAFEDVGERELKGVPDRWRLYRVSD
jgi:class 3 adenylate cyclase/pimeloyl-ACP methyl ester carboxylesterase